MFETVVPTGSIETLVLLTAIAAAAILTLALIEIVRDVILLRAGLWLDHMLGQHMLENGLKLGVPPNELRGDARALAMLKAFLTSPAPGSVFDAPWMPFFLVALVLIHPMIGGVAIVSALLLLMAALAQGLLSARPQAESARALERSEQWWQTVTGNSQLAGALGLSRGAAEQWEVFNRAHVASAYSLGKRASIVKAFARAVRVASQIALYGVGAWLVVRNDLAPGALVSSAILLARALSPLEHAVSALKSAQAAWAAFRRLGALPADAVVPRVGEGEAPPPGNLVLADVTYFHPGRKALALRGISLEMKPGECLGIVGPNGAGKSALCGVLAGALLPTNGSATLDGVPIAKWQRGDCSPPIGYLPDEPALIEGSVHDNIARFRDVSLMTVAQAGMRAGVHETLSGLLQGYDTAVGPQGSGLALRERRAVALARAVCGEPRIVVLDEPEVGLDGASLRRLMKVVESLKADGIGVVVATQDPRLLRLTDKVAVLNGGALQSVGSSEELSRKLASSRQAEAQGVGLH